jgi:hypothetical protein
MLLGVKGGLSNGGVGTCKIGRGGALVVNGSVTPGIEGMSGGSDRHSARVIRHAAEARAYFILNLFGYQRLVETMIIDSNVRCVEWI